MLSVKVYLYLQHKAFDFLLWKTDEPDNRFTHLESEADESHHGFTYNFKPRIVLRQIIKLLCKLHVLKITNRISISEHFKHPVVLFFRQWRYLKWKSVKIIVTKYNFQRFSGAYLSDIFLQPFYSISSYNQPQFQASESSAQRNTPVLKYYNGETYLLLFCFYSVYKPKYVNLCSK